MSKIRSKIQKRLNSNKLIRAMGSSKISPSLILDMLLATAVLGAFFAAFNPYQILSHYKDMAKLSEAYIVANSVQIEINDFLSEKNQWPSQQYIESIFNKDKQNWNYVTDITMIKNGFSLSLEKGLAGLKKPKLTYHSLAGVDPAYTSVTWYCGYAGLNKNQTNETNLPKKILAQDCI